MIYCIWSAKCFDIVVHDTSFSVSCLFIYTVEAHWAQMEDGCNNGWRMAGTFSLSSVSREFQLKMFNQDLTDSSFGGKQYHTPVALSLPSSYYLITIQP